MDMWPQLFGRRYRADAVKGDSIVSYPDPKGNKVEGVVIRSNKKTYRIKVSKGVSYTLDGRTRTWSAGAEIRISKSLIQ